MQNDLGYAGKRVILTGAASGVGAATAQILVELGAEVHAIDIKKPDQSGLASYTECDLREPEQIDAAVERIGRVVNMLFNCAGLPKTSPDLDVMLVNFCGLRELAEKVSSMIPEGGAIASITSTAGVGWMQHMTTLGPLLATPDFASARAWCEANPGPRQYAYRLSAQAVNAYTFFRSLEIADRDVRLNCVNLGPSDDSIVPLGRVATREEQAWPIVFLNSPRASFVSGAHVNVDGGLDGASTRTARPVLNPRRPAE